VNKRRFFLFTSYRYIIDACCQCERMQAFNVFSNQILKQILGHVDMNFGLNV